MNMLANHVPRRAIALWLQSTRLPHHFQHQTK